MTLLTSSATFPEERLSLAQFFESTPPGAAMNVDATIRRSIRFSNQFELALPVLELHCDSEVCGGPRRFASDSERRETPGGSDFSFIWYTCQNCSISQKIFSCFMVFPDAPDQPLAIQKLGEMPEFGPPIPSGLSKLIGSERDYFFKGRRAENQSMGIASFAYYRRVVESKKSEILDAVLKASRQVGADSVLIEDLERAKKETQFTSAVAAVKHAIPQALLIDGHNPLTLLHSALSEGLHAHTDEECLQLATSIRVVLTELVERTASILKEERELKQAVAKLLQVRENRVSPSPTGGGIAPTQ